jgi:5-methyltetrahydrofolate--homocysteine methyltransferase
MPARLYSRGGRGQTGSSGAVRCDCGQGCAQALRGIEGCGKMFLFHALQALAIESAEGVAEYLHRRIGEDWCLPDPLR